MTDAATPHLLTDERPSRAQITRLVKIGKNFNKAIRTLPKETQRAYANEHRTVVDAKKEAAVAEEIHRMRF